MVKFQRTKFRAYVKLGSKQKSKRKYKRATGRHNKTRQKWKSRPRMVEIGYKNKSRERGLISGKIPILVKNLEDVKKANTQNIIIIGKIGKKKKLEIAKEIQQKKISVFNLNINKFLMQIEKEKIGEKQNEKTK